MHQSIDTHASPGWLRAALVLRAHGVCGELRVEPLGGNAGRFTVGLRLHVEPAGGRELTVRRARDLPEGELLLTVDEVTSRDAAEALRGAYLCVDAADARPLGNDEWFVHQLVGLQAMTPDGRVLGAVRDVESYAAHDVLVIGEGRGARRFPLSTAFVRRVDVAGGVIEVTPWPEEQTEGRGG